MILVFVEHIDFQPKKSSLETLNFANSLSTIDSGEVKAIYLGTRELSINLGVFGVKEVYHIDCEHNCGSDQIAAVLSDAIGKLSPKYFMLSHSSLGKTIAGQIAVKSGMGLISGAVGVVKEEKVKFRKTVFSGKAYAYYGFNENGGIVTVVPNSISAESSSNELAQYSTLNLTIPQSQIRSVEKKLVKGKTPLAEATIVVSAGRGMKDPSNWGMIEELADLLGATTACSRPVADVGWRPHHEHVGQTGIAIRPNVYIAIGISGAIQHLAGVNNSRNIIVINKDPEAPFFKAADYGICGDLFEVVPKLNEAIRKAKSV
ncbi:MAG: electron transfer flavoprotein subunit alpha/FixB family protein [Saprospiraceae bacterium]|nr:electron transfer flavoprotein subunit alpha/FixB family protein [Candidatus Vicinibacter affinis]